jgi:hypothetical protein
MLGAGSRRLFYMLVLQNSRYAALAFRQTAGFAVGSGLVALALVTTGCSRDDLAPDCFKIDPDTGVCLIPDPGGTAPGINCDVFPEGAVGAAYDFTPAVGGGSGNFNMWMATNLPAGLTIDPNTGTISGVPTMAGTSSNIGLSMFDTGKGEGFDATCGDMVINDALNANRVAMETNHCIDVSASFDDMLALLDGGDGTDITCSPLANDAGSATCPLGDGNGRMAPGISFNDSSCTHSGSVSGGRRGTWVWMVEITQSDYTTRVPFCVTNDVDTFHDITETVEAVPGSDLTPGLYEYNPNADLAFGAGTHQWAIDDPACPGADCNTYGFRFNVTCSPFDVTAPWQVTLSPSAQSPTGMTHEMSATGPAQDSKFDGRPFVASFEMSYCTSATGGFCETADATAFEQNAQTQYHFDVVGFPTQ